MIVQCNLKVWKEMHFTVQKFFKTMREMRFSTIFIQCKSVVLWGHCKASYVWGEGYPCKILSSQSSGVGGGRKGVLLGIRGRNWEFLALFSKSWLYFRPNKVIFDTCFQTWPPRNLTSSLLRLERQQKNIFLKIHFEFAYFSSFLFYLKKR